MNLCMFGYGVPIQEPKNKCRKVEKLEIPCNYHRTTILQTLFAIFFLGCYTQLVFFFFESLRLKSSNFEAIWCHPGVHLDWQAAGCSTPKTVA